MKDYISEVHNYCDHWCERCPLTHRCAIYDPSTEHNKNTIPVLMPKPLQKAFLKTL